MVNLDAAFFASVRADLFSNHLTQPQVDGMKGMADAWNVLFPLESVHEFAYCLATAYHETGRAMQPIEEVGKGRDHSYGIADPVTHQIYYGRGFVQLTWKVNYQKMATLLNVDLVNKPELALTVPVASDVMFKGMTLGTFTGKKLSDYFNANGEDPTNARRIINGTDRAADIADYYDDFMAALAPNVI